MCWVCLSDLHLGAENSVLSNLPPGSLTVDPGEAGTVLEALAACLRALVDELAEQPPTLVLNGDVMEMALASEEVATRSFDRLIDVTFGEQTQLFDETVVYVPGNHDHHVWEATREKQYATYVARTPRDQPLERPPHVTQLFQPLDEPAVTAELLTALVQRRLGHERVVVRTAYPNYGIAPSDAPGIVVFHHGHFVESFYRLMTFLRRALFPNHQSGDEVADWEADNFAWIDFLFSALGRSGDVGTDVGLIYEMAGDKDALRWLADNLSRAVSTQASGPITRDLLASALRFVLGGVAGRVAGLERTRHEVLSDHSREGLVRYLGRPLRTQLEQEQPGASAKPVSVVIGHTHKPFEELFAVDGYGQDVAVYNTGGWVVDTPNCVETQGASVVLVDSAGNVASIRLYNQQAGAAKCPVTVARSLAAGPNPLEQRLRDLIRSDEPPWSDFSAVLAGAVVQRRETLPWLIAAGMAPDPGR